MKKTFLIIFLIALGLRLYNLTAPIADWHSFRQVDTVSVSQQLKKQFNPFYPKYHDLSNLQSGQDNPQGWRMVEFPIYNLLALAINKLFFLPLVISHRLVNIILSLATGFILYHFVLNRSKDKKIAFISMVIFLFLPFNIYYSRTTLPDITAVFFMVVSLYFFNQHLFLSAIALSLALLVKPFTAFIIFPILLADSINKIKNKPSSIFSLIIFSAISLLPIFAWRQWINQFPAGIPDNAWLFNQSDQPIFPDWYKGFYLGNINKIVAFRPHWFKWLFYHRISKLILGYFGLIGLIFGLLSKKKHLLSWLLFFGILLFFIIVAQGNIQHDYYQLLIIPSITIITATGLSKLNQKIILSILLVAFFFSAKQIKTYYKINHPQIISAGQAVQQLTPADSLIIAPYNGDTTLLFQTKRSGWPVQIRHLSSIKRQHPHQPIYFVSTAFDDYTNDMINTYPPIKKTDQYIILDLNHDQKIQ